MTEHRRVFVQVNGLLALPSPVVIKDDGSCGRDLSALVVPAVGRLVGTGERYEPYRMLGPDGMCMESATAFFRDLLAAGRAEATVRSYGMDLLRWYRLLRTIEVRWNHATRIEARDFGRWLRSGKGGVAYAASVRAHSETVPRTFYDFHLEVGSGPLVHPFPLDRSRRAERPRAPQPDGAVPPRTQRVVSAAGAVESGPCPGGLLRVHRGAGLGTVVRDGGWGGPGSAADHRGAQGHPGAAAAAGLQ
ncbi:MAG: site-specific integrase [Haloechinothrix sp.]